MKTISRILVLCLFSSSLAQAFTLTSLHSFAVAPKGAQPHGALLPASGDLFYGTTLYGGTNGGGGTVFTISTNGTLRTLYSFNGYADGNGIMGGLAADSDGTLYGGSMYGGQYSQGAIFKMATNGTLTVLYSFGATTNAGGTALDGSHPEGGLVRGRDGSLYGTTYDGGSYNEGTVFRISTNGLLSTLYSFGTAGSVNGTALDGANPVAGLIQGADGAFYGTCSYGGVNDTDYGGDGTVFQITTNGTLTTLYSFAYWDGASPDASLVQAADGSLYGTASMGGNSDSGTAFQITTNGALTTLYNFSGGDGADPEAALLPSQDGNLYGTTAEGGANEAGTLFRLATDGSLTTLVHFGGASGATPMAGLVQTADGKIYGTTQLGGANGIGIVFQVTTGGVLSVLFSFPQVNDGANPSADLLLARDGNFYGTTEAGGDYGYGTIFRLTAAGNLTLLYTFGSLSNSYGDALDGAYSEGVLIQGQDGSLYGTAPGGGDYQDGTIFSITTNGSFSRLYSFSSSDGASPWGGLTQTADGALYGTTSWGGASDDGTLFRITTNGDFTTLYSFSGSDGNGPDAGLVRGLDGFLYGTTAYGGANDSGTVFKCDTNGSLSTLYSFSGGADGSDPEDALFAGQDGALYGTTYSGGSANDGTVFRLTTNGTLTTLASFAGTNGANPLAGVVRTADGTLYGTASEGGTGNNGGIFQIAANGDFSWLSLDGITGSYPDSGVVIGPDGNLYTLAENGGLGGYGNIFRVNILPSAPVLQKLVKAGNSLVLTWSAIANRNYQLEYKTNLAQADWKALGSSVTATNTTMRISDTPGSDARRFYRIGLLP
jgi:uncharacterized repeat protein (TIGR03803 family)